METLKKFWATVVAWFTMAYHVVVTSIQMFWYDVVSFWWKVAFYVVAVTAYKPVDWLAKLFVKAGDKLTAASDKLKVVLVIIRMKW